MVFAAQLVHNTGCLVDPSEDRTSYRLIEVTLRKPMGLVLAEAKDRKAVVVEEIVKGGNAEQSGQVSVGDVVSKCSATVLKAGKGGEYEKEGYGQRPYDNWEKVMFDCDGEDFDTVMAAIGSNTERWGIFSVSLVLKRYISSDTPA
ncbi:g1991 [Coccomyxa elongata]